MAIARVGGGGISVEVVMGKLFCLFYCGGKNMCVCRVHKFYSSIYIYLEPN